jgi:hypothetical protein
MPKRTDSKDFRLKKQRKVGSIEDALLIQWRAISAAQEALYHAGKQKDVDGVLKAVHAITQAAGAFGNLKEKAELEARLAELEKLMEQRKHTNGRRAYA